MERWIGRTALVTGATAGIGAGIARALVRRGMKVAACARNMDRLQAMKEKLKDESGTLFPYQCDLRDTSAIEAMFKSIKTDIGGVDVCVNNAGLNFNSALIGGRTEHFNEILQVNVLALTICTREAVQSMLERKVDDGHIFHISSMSGYRLENVPSNHFYAATKQAVRALTEGLRQELAMLDSHIRITAVSPGNVSTEFGERMFAEDKALQAQMLKESKTIKELEVDDIVAAFLHALDAPPHVQIHDILIRPVEQKE